MSTSPLPVPDSAAPPPSYRLAAIDALCRGDRDVYGLLSSKPGVGPNPDVPTIEEMSDYIEGMYDQRWLGPRPSALHLCADRGLTASVQTVIGQMSAVGTEVEVDRDNDDGTTALWYAASKGHTDTVRVLCETGKANVNLARHHAGGWKHESSPLYVAAERGHTDTVAVLLPFGADPNYYRQHFRDNQDTSSVLEKACQGGHTDADSHRTHRHGQPDDQSALHDSVDCPPVMSLLIHKSTNIDRRSTYRTGPRDDMTALQLACAGGDPLCIRLLCDAGADVSGTTTFVNGYSRCTSALGLAVSSGSVGRTTVLLSTGAADPFAFDDFDQQPLIDVVSRRRSLSVLMDSRPSVVLE